MSEIDGRFSTVIRKDLRKRFWAHSKRGTLINDLLDKNLPKELKTPQKLTKEQ